MVDAVAWPCRSRKHSEAQMSAGLVTRALWDRLRPPPEGALFAIAVAVGYYASAHLAFFIGTLSDQIFAPFWPPNVFLFCGLLLSPRERWGLILAVTFLAHVLAEMSVG